MFTKNNVKVTNIHKGKVNYKHK